LRAPQFAVDETKAYRVAALSNVDLHRYKIRTAADVTRERLKTIPEIGYVIDDEMMQWRCSLEEQFKPDPRQAIDFSKYAKIDRDIEAEGWELEFILKKDLPRFRQISESIQSTRRNDMKEVEASYHAYLQARGELLALVGGAEKLNAKRWDSGADRRSFIMRCSDLARSSFSSVLRS
jgi:DNA-binding helix-hairpin-helix protein with protein kinase domain